MEMDKQAAGADIQITRKRKREQEGVDGMRAKKQSMVTGIGELPDDMLIAILSCLSLKDALKTSAISARWRYLWTFTSGALEFDDRNTATGTKIKRKRFKALVNRVLKSHQGQRVDSLIIRFANSRLRARSSDIDSWIYFAMDKEVKRFELNLSVSDGFHCSYEFPSIEKLLVKSGFGCLRTLKLVDVDIKDEVVQYILTSCPYIEQLCIRASNAIENLQVVDPLPNLKELEISNCRNIQSLEISAMNLVSCTYRGSSISSPFKKTPDLFELTLGGLFCKSFIFEPTKHSSYSVQLVNLVLDFPTVTCGRAIVPTDLPRLCSLKRLELNTMTKFGYSLLFFTSLVEACPNLQEFKIKIEYYVYRPKSESSPPRQWLAFPNLDSATASGYHRKDLKIVEMVGFIGHSAEEKFLIEIFKVASSVEKVFIDTQSDYYPSHPMVSVAKPNGEKPRWARPSYIRKEAKSRAKRLKKYCRRSVTKFVVT